jgi:hypothetical protein
VGLAKAGDGGGADAIFEMIASSAAIAAFAMTAKSRSISILVLPSSLEKAAYPADRTGLTIPTPPA